MKTEEMRGMKLLEGQELVLQSQFSTEVLNNINTEEKRQANGEEKSKIGLILTQHLGNRCFSSLQLLGLFASSKFYGNLELCISINV